MQTELNLTGEQLRDDGAERVTDNTREDWIAAADAAIVRLARSGQPFSAEDVRAAVGDPPGHANAMGARMLAAAKHGLLEKIGYGKPTRASSHASVIAIWRGVSK